MRNLPRIINHKGRKEENWSSFLQSFDPETLTLEHVKGSMVRHWHYKKYSLVPYFFLFICEKSWALLAFLLFILDSRIIIKSHFIQYSYRNHASVEQDENSNYTQNVL